MGFTRTNNPLKSLNIGKENQINSFFENNCPGLKKSDYSIVSENNLIKVIVKNTIRIDSHLKDLDFPMDILIVYGSIIKNTIWNQIETTYDLLLPKIIYTSGSINLGYIDKIKKYPEKITVGGYFRCNYYSNYPLNANEKIIIENLKNEIENV